MRKERPKTPFIEAAIASIGSVASLILHSIFFVACFLLSLLGIVEWQMMLLVLTTVVSLEAIYMAIFIQIAVNRNTEQLREVEEDIDEIQEDVEELGEDVEDIQEDIEEISEDIDEIQEDVEEMSEEEKAEQKVTQQKQRKEKREKAALDEAALLEQLSSDVQKLLADLEALKKPKQ
jgi:TolA-binding protein